MGTFATNGEAVEHLQLGSPSRFTTTGDQQRAFLSEDRGERLVDPERRGGETGLLERPRLALTGYCVKHSGSILPDDCDGFI